MGKRRGGILTATILLDSAQATELRDIETSIAFLQTLQTYLDGGREMNCSNFCKAASQKRSSLFHWQKQSESNPQSCFQIG